MVSENSQPSLSGLEPATLRSGPKVTATVTTKPLFDADCSCGFCVYIPSECLCESYQVSASDPVIASGLVCRLPRLCSHSDSVLPLILVMRLSLRIRSDADPLCSLMAVFSGHIGDEVAMLSSAAGVAHLFVIFAHVHARGQF